MPEIYTVLFNHNYHTHTHYCDGSSAPEEYVKAAIKAGMNAIGFSSHAPVPFENNYAIKDSSSLRDYVDEINRLKEQYSDKIDIYLGLEADYIPGVTLGFDHFVDDFGLDYIIGSVHLVKSPGDGLWFIDGPDSNIWRKGLERFFDMDIRKAVTAYYRQIVEMVESQKPYMVGHLDKIKMHNQGKFFLEEEPWYRDLIHQTLAAISRNDCIVEVNTRGIYKKRSDSLFPGEWVLEEMLKRDIPVTICSDAHDPTELSLYLDEASKILKNTGYKETYCLKDEEWKAVPLD